MLTSALYFILLGIALGLSLAGAPGPVNAVLATEAIKSKLHGISVGLGATTADLTYFVVVFLFASLIPKTFVNYLYLVGGLLMLYMAYKINGAKQSNRSHSGNYFVGFAMAITSPFNLGWWLTAGLFLMQNISIYSVVGLFAGILLWVFSFSTIIFKLRKRIDTRLMQHISGIILALFGIFMLYESVILIL